MVATFIPPESDPDATEALALETTARIAADTTLTTAVGLKASTAALAVETTARTNADTALDGRLATVESTRVDVRGVPGGAVGDGVADDSEAIRAKLMTAGILGAELWFSAGRYCYNDDAETLVGLSNVSWRGVPGASIIDFSGRTVYANESDGALILLPGELTGDAHALVEDARRPPLTPLSVVSITRAGSVATVTLETPHGLSAGEQVLVRGGGGSVASGQEAFYTETNNGVASDPVTVASTPTSTTLTYAIAPRWKPASGAATTNVIAVVGHGYVLDSPVVFEGDLAGSGLAAETTYYARDISANALKVAAAPGGAEVDLALDFTASVAGIIDAALTGAAHVDTQGRFLVVGETASFGAGDMVWIVSDAERTDEGSEVIQIGEPNTVHRVISSTVLALDLPVGDDYLVTDGASVQRVAPAHDIHFDGLTFVGKGTNLSPTEAGDKLIRFDFFRDVSVRNCTFENVDLVNCEFRTGLNWAFARNAVTFDSSNIAGRVSGHAYVNYGCSYANGARGGLILNNTFTGGRHHVVQASSSARAGISRDVLIDGNTHINSWLGAVSTHQGFDSATISNNTFQNCQGSVTIRYARDVRIAGNRITGGELGIQVSKHWGEGCLVTGNIVRRCWSPISLTTQVRVSESLGELGITQNDIDGCESGIELHATLPDTVMRGIRVDGNRLRNVSKVPISIIAGVAAGRAITAVAATNVCTAAGNNYTDGDLVILSNLTGGTGLSEGRAWVRDRSGDTFKLAATPGGAAIDITTDLTAGTASAGWFSGSIRNNDIDSCGTGTAGNAIRLTNAHGVVLAGNRVESWTGMTRGIYADGAGTWGCAEHGNTILGATTTSVDFTTGRAHRSEYVRSETLTIAAGWVAPRYSTTTNLTIDTEAAAATDDLNGIRDPGSGGPDGWRSGHIIFVSSATSARDPRVLSSGGNIKLIGGTAVTLNDTRDSVMLRWKASASELHHMASADL